MCFIVYKIMGNFHTRRREQSKAAADLENVLNSLLIICQLYFVLVTTSIQLVLYALFPSTRVPGSNSS